MEILKNEVGCLACQLLGYGYTPPDLHHLISPRTGHRISHQHTIPLCPFHHRMSPTKSIHHAKKKFAEEFGSDTYLLALADTAVAEFERNTIGGKG